jgi:hypothetical protein
LDHRRTGWLALVAAVTALHLALLPAVWPVRLGEGAADPRRPERLQVSFVQTLQPSEPTRRLQPVQAAPRRAAQAALEQAEPAASAAALGAPELPPLAGLPPELTNPVPSRWKWTPWRHRRLLRRPSAPMPPPSTGPRRPA